jgi:hypothetical protein
MPSQRSYYIQRNAKVIGPFSPDAVRDRIGKGKIRVTDQIGRASDGPWQAIGNVQGWAKLFEAQSAADPFDVFSSDAYGDDASQVSPGKSNKSIVTPEGQERSFSTDEGARDSIPTAVKLLVPTVAVLLILFAVSNFRSVGFDANDKENADQAEQASSLTPDQVQRREEARRELTAAIEQATNDADSYLAGPDSSDPSALLSTLTELRQQIVASLFDEQKKKDFLNTLSTCRKSLLKHDSLRIRLQQAFEDFVAAPPTVIDSTRYQAILAETQDARFSGLSSQRSLLAVGVKNALDDTASLQRLSGLSDEMLADGIAGLGNRSGIELPRIGEAYADARNAPTEVQRRRVAANKQRQRQKEQNWSNTRLSPIVISNARQVQLLDHSGLDGAAVILNYSRYLPVNVTSTVSGEKGDMEKITLHGLLRPSREASALRIEISETLSERLALWATRRQAELAGSSSGYEPGGVVDGIFLKSTFNQMLGSANALPNVKTPSSRLATNRTQFAFCGRLHISEAPEVRASTIQVRRVIVTRPMAEAVLSDHQSLAYLSRHAQFLSADQEFSASVYQLSLSENVRDRVTVAPLIRLLDEFAQHISSGVNTGPLFPRSAYAGVLSARSRDEIEVRNQQISDILKRLLYDGSDADAAKVVAKLPTGSEKATNRISRIVDRGAAGFYLDSLRAVCAGTSDSGMAAHVPRYMYYRAMTADVGSKTLPDWNISWQSVLQNEIMFPVICEDGISLVSGAEADGLLSQISDLCGFGKTVQNEKNRVQQLVSKVNTFQPQAPREPYPPKPRKPYESKGGWKTIEYFDAEKLGQDTQRAAANGDRQTWIELQAAQGAAAATQSGSQGLKSMFSSDAKARASHYIEKRRVHKPAVTPSQAELAAYADRMAAWHARVAEIDEQWQSDQKLVMSAWPERKANMLVLLDELQESHSLNSRKMRGGMVQLRKRVENGLGSDSDDLEAAEAERTKLLPSISSFLSPE